ncbi:MAG: hypothetical protein ACPLKP_01790 [Microgenomates group bacterium]
MREREKLLTSTQKEALRVIADALQGEEPTVVVNKKELEETFGLSPFETEQTLALVVLTFHYASKENGGEGIPQRLKRRLAGFLVNSPPGLRNKWEEEQGKTHRVKGYFRTGRNYQGKRKAGF